MDEFFDLVDEEKTGYFNPGAKLNDCDRLLRCNAPPISQKTSTPEDRRVSNNPHLR